MSQVPLTLDSHKGLTEHVSTETETGNNNNSSSSSSSSSSHSSSSSSSSHSSTTARYIGYWLIGTAGMVFAMVSLGGVTRLTRSGLSIVEWRPEGEKLPRTDEEWIIEFEKYKSYPEYQRVNSRMSLEEFKPIYFMEWAHRMWGRALGIVFGAPLVVFIAKGMLPPGFTVRLAGLFLLGGGQGAIGWWMVKSGLQHERFEGIENSHVRVSVSPYRLATHLSMAFSLYSLLLWNAWDMFLLSSSKSNQLIVTSTELVATSFLRPFVFGSAGVIATTVFSGAFVAGNDAGHAYNDWPLFAGQLVPEELWIPSLGFRNFFENTACVQFLHRNLAYTSIGTVALLHGVCARQGGLNKFPITIQRGIILMSVLVTAQASLGIVTLLLYVPIELGALHQAGSLALWTSALYTVHSIVRVRRGLPLKPL